MAKKLAKTRKIAAKTKMVRSTTRVARVANAAKVTKVKKPKRLTKAEKEAYVAMHGGSFFGNVWNGIKKGAKWVADQKLISKGLALIPDGRAQLASKAASMAGLGSSHMYVQNPSSLQGRMYIG